MRRMAHLSVAAGVIALALTSAYSAEPMRREGMAAGMVNDSTAGRKMMKDKDGMGGMGMGMMGKEGMDGMGMMGMMGMMIPSKVIVVDDGYIVQVCNTLIKYDKDLNKKKEVVVALDSMAMRGMMQQMTAMKTMHMEHMKAMHDMPMGAPKEIPVQEKGKEKKK